MDNVSTEQKNHYWKKNEACIFNSWTPLKTEEQKVILKSPDKKQQPDIHYRYSCSMYHTRKIKRTKPLKKLKQEQRSKQKQSYLKSYLLKNDY